MCIFPLCLFMIISYSWGVWMAIYCWNGFFIHMFLLGYLFYASMNECGLLIRNVRKVRKFNYCYQSYFFGWMEQSTYADCTSIFAEENLWKTAQPNHVRFSSTDTSVLEKGSKFSKVVTCCLNCIKRLANFEETPPRRRQPVKNFHSCVLANW